MPDINFDCPSCSQNLDAPDNMAGQALPCPACGQEMTIPAPSAPAPAPVPEPAAAPAPTAEPESVPELTEDIPVTAVAAPETASDESAGNPCPGCGADLAPDAVICIQCGYNLKTGEKMGGL